MAMYLEAIEAVAEVLGKGAVSYTHLRAHETVLELVCSLLLEKKTLIAQDIVFLS